MTTQPPGPASPHSPSVDPALSDRVAHAVADLAERLGTAADEVTVLSAEAVTWPDAALGCREPGGMYAQMLTDGVRIVLAHGDSTFNYHAGGNQAAFLCEHPTS